MLIALYLLLYSFFGGTAGLSERVEDVVADPVRMEAALEALDNIAEIEAAVSKQLEETSAAFRAVHMDYGATREDYLAAVAPMQQVRNEAGSKLQDAWSGLRSALTTEEWKEIFPPTED
ncbi:MAG: hypothetical protein ACI8X5_001865 [Planctomycetota bacterium]|jgi:hypothetical protein